MTSLKRQPLLVQYKYPQWGIWFGSQVFTVRTIQSLSQKAFMLNKLLLLLLQNVLLWRLISTVCLIKERELLHDEFCRRMQCNRTYFCIRDVSPSAHKWETYARLKLNGPFHLFMTRLGNIESFKAWKDHWHLECENSGTFFHQVHISFFCLPLPWNIR